VAKLAYGVGEVLQQVDVNIEADDEGLVFRANDAFEE
jgi:hypothetical protein